MACTTKDAPFCCVNAAEKPQVSNVQRFWPRTPLLAHNLVSMAVDACITFLQEDASLQHPQPAFMSRAIYLSRVAGLEKRTGEHWMAQPPLSPPLFACMQRNPQPNCISFTAVHCCPPTNPPSFPPQTTGGCFGAVIVKDGKIVGEGYNNVISRNDPTW